MIEFYDGSKPLPPKVYVESDVEFLTRFCNGLAEGALKRKLGSYQTVYDVVVPGDTAVDVARRFRRLLSRYD